MSEIERKVREALKPFVVIESNKVIGNIDAVAKALSAAIEPTPSLPKGTVATLKTTNGGSAEVVLLEDYFRGGDAMVAINWSLGQGAPFRVNVERLKSIVEVPDA